MKPSPYSAALALMLACSPALAETSAPATTESTPQRQTLLAAVDGIAARAQDIPVAGMTIGIWRAGAPVVVRGYGLADIERGVPAAADTIYEIGSVTKQFTAAAVLRLAEQGKLQLDDSIAVYFPALATRGEGVTLRHLLNHTSGLYSGTTVDDLTLPTDPAAIVEVLAMRDSDFAPGARHRYNNNGYQLLGLVVEQVSGKTWGTYLAEEFFKPLALRATAICDSSSAANTARAYRHDTRGNAPPAPHEQHHPSVNYAAGSLCSTAADMLAWQHALASGQVVSPSSYAWMTTRTPLPSGKSVSYGMGLYVTEVDGIASINHGGASSGFLAQLAYYPDREVGVVVLMNGAYAGALVEQVEQAVFRATIGLPQPAVLDLPLDVAARARYAGTYDLGRIQMEVYAQGRHLRAAPTGQVAGRLFYQGNDTFTAEHDPAVSIRFEVEGERAMSLIISKNGKAMPPGKRKL